jgi:flagellar motor switch/type III secretory pathway protein FliN
LYTKSNVFEKKKEKEMAAKKTTTDAAAKKPAAKTTAKTSAAKTETKAVEEKPEKAPKAAAVKDIKTKIAVQFGGKGYETDDFVKMAKDVWKFDLKREIGDLKQIELYVKPEESKVYYVFNGSELGSFDI